MIPSSIPSIIVIPLGDLGWFSRHEWLGSGISNTLTQKLRVLPFVRAFSVLAVDGLLDSCGLATKHPKDDRSALKVKRILPVDAGVIYGTIKIRGDKLWLVLRIIAGNMEKREVNWRGEYARILEGINIVSLAASKSLAHEAAASQLFVQMDGYRFEKIGIPNSIQAYEAFCRATYSRLGTEKARLYEEAIRFDPSFASAYAGLGTHHARHGRLSNAVACFKKQLEIEPDDAIGHCCLGMAYGEQGIYDAALSELNRALELYPQGDPDVFSNLGAIYHRIERFNEALSFYQKGLELNPGDGDIHFNIAKCLLAQGKYASSNEVLLHLEKALDLYGPISAEKRSRVLALLSELPR